MKIGDVVIDPPVVLAPMAGITNHAFRLICRQLGAGAVWTEMISSFAIRYRNKRTFSMFDWTDTERPVAVQIFGGDPDAMALGAQVVESAGADIVDINLGCPVPKVRKTGAGSALMDDLDTARKVMAAVVGAVKVPVTVKTRIGPHGELTTAVDMARIAEDVGIVAVSVHGRTVEQRYTGNADWDIIAQVKGAVSIPVIGNGDARTPQDVRRMLEQTGCDAVMIGRAALGNPWLFKRSAHYLSTGELLPEPTLEERAETAREHLMMIVELHGESRAIREMRGQLSWYAKGLPCAAQHRRRVTEATTIEEMERVLVEMCMPRETDPHYSQEGE